MSLRHLCHSILLTHSQNGKHPKINPEKVACFSTPKKDPQLTSIHQHPTTNSPAKNHVLHPVFAKTPSKNGVNRARKKLLQKPLFRLRLRFLRRDDDRGGHFVLRFEVEQLDPLGAAARGPVD